MGDVDYLSCTPYSVARSTGPIHQI
jgi:hypothetical protein